MMPQEEVGEAIHRQTTPDYGRYEGSHARQPSEPSYAQDVREGQSGKVYPLSQSKLQIFRLAMPLIALGMLLLFAWIFVIGVGGTAGWTSFVASCFVIMGIMAYTFMLGQPGD
ncbi:MAG TPA: hypothetical protein VKR06_01225 [Ktedonosporobacter sp.]|nr:hypothetical protein [Ktedonosporobacter sp.]